MDSSWVEKHDQIKPGSGKQVASKMEGCVKAEPTRARWCRSGQWCLNGNTSWRNTQAWPERFPLVDRSGVGLLLDKNRSWPGKSFVNILFFKWLIFSTDRYKQVTYWKGFFFKGLNINYRSCSQLLLIIKSLFPGGDVKRMGHWKFLTSEMVTAMLWTEAMQGRV